MKARNAKSHPIRISIESGTQLVQPGEEVEVPTLPAGFVPVEPVSVPPKKKKETLEGDA